MSAQEFRCNTILVMECNTSGDVTSVVRASAAVSYQPAQSEQLHEYFRTVTVLNRYDRKTYLLVVTSPWPILGHATLLCKCNAYLCIAHDTATTIMFIVDERRASLAGRGAGGAGTKVRRGRGAGVARRACAGATRECDSVGRARPLARAMCSAEWSESESPSPERAERSQRSVVGVMCHAVVLGVLFSLPSYLYSAVPFR